MKNVPNKLFIQVGDLSPYELEDLNFFDLVGVTFSVDRIYESDIEYKLGDDYNDFYCRWISEGYHEKCSKQCVVCKSESE